LRITQKETEDLAKSETDLHTMHPDSTTPPSSKPSKGRVFLERLASTIVLWGMVLGALFFGTPFVSTITVWIVISCLCLVAYQEFLRMTQLGGMSFGKYALHAVGVCYLTLLVFRDQPFMAPFAAEIPMICLGLACACMLYLFFHYRDEVSRLSPIAKLGFGWFYVYFLGGFMVQIYGFDAKAGPSILILFIVLTKFSDLGAYVTGSLLGRHKMIPTVSPGKTWEGFLGGIGFSVGFGLLMVIFFPATLGKIPMGHVVLLGIMLGGMAVLGDLVESLLKREAGVKDSGGFLPGIGGGLDLLDSLLFNAPIMYAWLRFFHHSTWG
jgi:phosphatidate cytidylyltransferase